LGRVDAENGTYKLSGTIPYRCHSLENHSLRLAHKVPDSIHGVLITRVSEDSDTVTTNDDDDEHEHEHGHGHGHGHGHEESLQLQLKPGDILTKIDDSEVADDGQVVLRGDELIQHAYLMRVKKKDEPVTFTVYREGKHIVCNPYNLKDIQPIIPRWENVDYMPNYMILGSLVLLPFFLGMKNFNQCGSLLKADCIEYYRRWPREMEGKEGLVVLVEIFAHELSFSYSRPWRRVVSYNGEKIKSLQHLQDLWNGSCANVIVTTSSSEQLEGMNGDNNGGSSGGDEGNNNNNNNNNNDEEKSFTFVRLELENDDDIVFEVEAAIEAQKEVMATHAISKAYNIMPPNPKYI